MHKRSQTVLNLNQINPDHDSLFHILKIHFILSLHLFQGLPNGVFMSGLPIKTLYSHLLSHIRATYPARFILLDFCNPSLHSIFCALYTISLTKINCLSEESKQSGMNFIMFSHNSIFRYSLLPSSSIFLSM